MPKRKTSFAIAYEKARKQKKARNNAAISKSLNPDSKTSATSKKPLAILKWPSINEHGPNEISENSVSPPLTEVRSSTPPLLRKVSTLPLEDLNQGEDSTGSSIPTPGSSGLYGSTPITADVSSLPKIPSGLTKFVLGTDNTTYGSLNISKSALITDVDDIEVDSALQSLKSKVKQPPTQYKPSLRQATKSLRNERSLSNEKSLQNERSLSKERSKGNERSLSNEKSLQNERSLRIEKSLQNERSLSKEKSLQNERSLSKEKSLQKERSLSNERSIRNERSEKNGEENVKKVGDSSDQTREDEIVLQGNDYMEVVIAIDMADDELKTTTIQIIKDQLIDIHQQLSKDIPGIRFAVMMGWGKRNGVRWLDFRATPSELKESLESMLKHLDAIRGQHCCHINDILGLVDRLMPWTPDSRRLVIYIDSEYKEPVPSITDICKTLVENEVKIYGVQLGLHQVTERLNYEMAKITGGLNLSLSSTAYLVNTIIMICLRESNPFNLKSYRRSQGFLFPEMERVYKLLCEGEAATPLSNYGHPVKAVFFKSLGSALRKPTAKTTRSKRQPSTLPNSDTTQYFTRSKGTIGKGNIEIKTRQKRKASQLCSKKISASKSTKKVTVRKSRPRKPRK